MTLSISELQIRISEDGTVEGDPVKLNVSLDVCPTWIEIAQSHLEVASAARIARRSAWDGTDDELKQETLETEFVASMQAIMASAIAFDAFYAALQHRIDLPQSLIDKWKSGRTARYSQVTEVVRQAFTLKPAGTKLLRSVLKQLYRFRDLAVHPTAQLKEPQFHPELELGMEWRFVYFRASNAETAVGATGGLLWDLAHNGKAKNAKVAEYIKPLAGRLQEIYPNGPPKLATDSSVGAGTAR